MRIAVFMLNLGGPSNLDEVRPFLRNLFADREIIRLPGGRLGQRLLSAWIARKKAPGSAGNYRQIGGGSPLLDWTRRQGEGMRQIVERELDVELLVQPCMRYWHPMSDEALRRAVDWGAGRIVAFSQYPHRSFATSDASIRELERVASKLGVTIPIERLDAWHDHPSYVHALAETVRCGVDQLASNSGAKVVYSAHSLPMKFVDAGDPYPEQIRATVSAVHEASGVDLPHELCWQSKVGPVRWLEPATIDRVCALPGEGFTRLVVVPISFVNDHIETLHELDIENRHAATAAGVTEFVRAPALNVRPAFLRALADVCGAKLRELGAAPRGGGAPAADDPRRPARR